uniref:Uncharacterized protein n=1 Tax=Alexandrium catenella TaxID=2925 RepID=A0A7S1RRW1_ALECA
MVDQHDEQQAQLAQLHQQKQEKREKSFERKAAESMRDSFIARQNAIAKTCQSVDYRNLKAQRVAQARNRNEAFRDKWTARTRLLESKHMMASAERRLLNTEDRQQVQYLLKKRRECEARELAESKLQVRAIRELDTHIKQARGEAVRHEESKSSEEAIQYNQTLSAFRELTGLVRAHGGHLQTLIDSFSAPQVPGDDEEEVEESVRPMRSVEPMVRQTLGRVGEELFVNVSQQESAFEPVYEDEFGDHGTGWGSEQVDSFAPRADDEEVSPQSGFGEDATAPSSPSGAQERSPARMLPQLTARAAMPVHASETETPLQRAEWRLPQPVLAVQPLRTLRSEFSTGNTMRRPTSSRAKREAQNLAALRQARVNGPFSARGHL